MTIRIAGETVAMGDQLYSRRASAWGRVTQVLDNAVVLTLSNSTNRKYTVTSGGEVAGVRDVFWHEPLELDLPKSKLGIAQKIQAFVDTAVEVL